MPFWICGFCLGITILVSFVGVIWAFRVYLWQVTLWIITTQVFKILLNIFLLYLCAIAFTGFYFLLNSIVKLPTRLEIFEMCIFPLRRKLKNEGFFEETNAQKGKFKYPNTPEEINSMANRAVRTALLLLLQNFIIFVMMGIIRMLPIDSYIYKSSLYGLCIAPYMIINYYILAIPMFDLVVIQAEPEPEDDLVEEPVEEVGHDAERNRRRRRRQNEVHLVHPIPNQLNRDAAIADNIIIEAENNGEADRADPLLAELPIEMAAIDANPVQRVNQERRRRRHVGGMRGGFMNHRYRPVYPIENLTYNSQNMMSFSFLFGVLTMCWSFVLPIISEKIIRYLIF